MEATLFEEIGPKVQTHFCEIYFGIYLYLLGKLAGTSLSPSFQKDLVIRIARIYCTRDHPDEVKASLNTTNS